MKRLIVTVLLGMVLMSACTQQASLVDTKWQLTDLPGQAIPADVIVTLNLGSDSIGGNDGCNSYGGSYTADKLTIQFGEDIFHTEMYCSDEIQAISTAYYESLVQSATYEMDETSLVLKDVNGIVLAEFAKTDK